MWPIVAISLLTFRLRDLFCTLCFICESVLYYSHDGADTTTAPVAMFVVGISHKVHTACIRDAEFEQQLLLKLNLLLSYQCEEVCICLHMLNLKSTIFVLMLVGL